MKTDRSREKETIRMEREKGFGFFGMKMDSRGMM